jgi:flagellar hook assembly protein FlgD
MLGLVAAWAAIIHPCTCLSGPGETPTLTISRVAVDNRGFDPAKSEQVKLRYYLSKAAGVTVQIDGRDDNRVATLSKDGPEGPGYCQSIWDGRGTSGKTVPPGAYFFKIEAFDETTGDSVTYDLTGTRGWDLVVSNVEMDEAGVISYELPEASDVSIRLGIAGGGPLLRTLENRRPHSGGKHTIEWDGWDNSGVVNLLGREDILVSIQARSLGSNVIVVEGEPAEPHPIEPEFHFRILNPEGLTDDSLTVVKDEMMIEVVFGEEQLHEGKRLGLEVMFFVDFNFLYEEEQPGKGTYVHKWNIRYLPEGEHILTVNMLDRDDRATASLSQILYVER